MEAEVEAKIVKTVREILEESDMTEMTEYKIRKLASEKLDINLSEPKYKSLVKRVVNTFLDEQHGKQEQEEIEEEEEEEEEKEEEEEERHQKDKSKEYNEAGDLVICRLTDKRMVTIQDFKGKTLVSIREYYKKDGKELPTAKGISLTEEQWLTLSKNIPAVEKAIEKMQSRW